MHPGPNRIIVIPELATLWCDKSNCSLEREIMGGAASKDQVWAKVQEMKVKFPDNRCVK